MINAAALAAKGMPRLPAGTWLVALVAIAVGSALGGPVARRLSRDTTRRLVLVLALAGALATVVRGVAGL